ncbi:MAG: cob(I)yrinic acid a,c-diamide adenosyltransferase [Planctomycetota bacterium]|jgi:cob(I)alamin adenosyltransferase
MTSERPDLGPGCLQVYTGDGKGKTTASLGLALRAAGAGLKVFFCQFLKGQEYSELEGLKRFQDLVTVKRFGGEKFIRGEPDEEDRRMAREGLEAALEVLTSGSHDLVVLDEASLLPHFQLCTLEALLSLVDARPDGVELVITGRNAPPELIDRADLVTEMKEVKHYYARGVQARKGIEK